MSHLVVKLLTRPGCRLCDQVRPLLTSVAQGLGASVEEVDIDSSPALTRDYGLRIPVVLGPDNEVLAEGEVRDRRVLRSALRRLA